MLGRVQTEKETGDSIMPLTHDFKETIRARAQRDPDFRQALLREAVECTIDGDLETGKAVLRDYVNATVGFQNLERRTQIPAKSLMRMLSPKRKSLGCKPHQHPDGSAENRRFPFRAGVETVSPNLHQALSILNPQGLSPPNPLRPPPRPPASQRRRHHHIVMF